MLRVEAVLNNGNTLVGYNKQSKDDFFNALWSNPTTYVFLRHDLEAREYTILNPAFIVNLFVSEISSDVEV